jgi:hypothetical protein
VRERVHLQMRVHFVLAAFVYGRDCVVCLAISPVSLPFPLSSLLISGDGEGKVFFWDFKSGKFFKYAIRVVSVSGVYLCVCVGEC